MRVIWWRITRPDTPSGPVELIGDSLSIRLPEDQSAVELLQAGGETAAKDWLSRLLEWTDGPPNS
jgi:hypothetical protein